MNILYTSPYGISLYMTQPAESVFRAGLKNAVS